LFVRQNGIGLHTSLLKGKFDVILIFWTIDMLLGGKIGKMFFLLLSPAIALTGGE
jgi:hypothetical protein